MVRRVAGLALVVALTISPACSSSEGAEHGLEVGFDDSAHHFTAEERETVTRIAVAAYEEVARLLPDLPDHVELVVGAGTSAQVIPETGEIGSATAPGVVSWVVDPSRPGGVDAIAGTSLRAALFHELHHLARGYVVTGGAPPTSFMDAVISEGLATAFQRDAAGASVPWGTYPDDVAHWVDELLALPLDAPYQQWMFQHPDGRRWIGYRAGTYLVDRAIRASGRSAADLVRAPTAEVLALAGVT
jgi:hypothetical protein